MTDYNEHQMLESLKIGSDLDLEFRTTPAYLARWGFQKASYHAEVRRAEEDLDLVWARLYSEYKQDNPNSKENEVKAHVMLHPDHKLARGVLRKAVYDLDMLRAAIKAAEAKVSMLQQLGAASRVEKGAYQNAYGAGSSRSKDDRGGRKLSQSRDAHMVETITEKAQTVSAKIRRRRRVDPEKLKKAEEERQRKIRQASKRIENKSK